ncbi:MAG: signal peptidase I [Zestosphaera sp.]
MKLRLSRILDLVLASLLLTLLLLSLSGMFTFAVVEGRSMEPLLWTGDVVVVYKDSDIGVGDVVIYAGRGGYVIHRVIEVHPDCLLIKGDNNPIPDGCIPKERIVGKVLSIGSSVVKVPGIGYLTLIVRGRTRPL